MAEVLVAIAILAATSAGLCKLAAMSMRASAQSRNHYLASCMARSRLETIKSRDFTQADRFVETNVTMNFNGVVDAKGDFRRTTTVTSVGTGKTDVAVFVAIRSLLTQNFDGEEEHVNEELIDFQERPR